MAYTLGVEPGRFKSPKTSKGKKLAVSRFGSTSDFVAEYALKHLGLKKTDVTMIQIGLEGDRLLAMQRGDISLSVFSPIITPVVKKAGMRILLDLEKIKVPYPLDSGTPHDTELLGKEWLRGRQVYASVDTGDQTAQKRPAVCRKGARQIRPHLRSRSSKNGAQGSKKNSSRNTDPFWRMA